MCFLSVSLRGGATPGGTHEPPLALHLGYSWWWATDPLMPDIELWLPVCKVYAQPNERFLQSQFHIEAPSLGEQTRSLKVSLLLGC